ncbi:MAG: SagB/ThcOx family dehydrogenase [Candidatus Auribacterota bacterium]|jgi:SagB-type dehydrogenase family enzyme|nr:SagB/ThcOx family dehydrogenase [Candidatus Auribacterota bacterium]
MKRFLMVALLMAYTAVACAQSDVHPQHTQPQNQQESVQIAVSVELPKPEMSGLTVEQAIMQRRSVRNYLPNPLTLAHLSQLLFAAQGITHTENGSALRSAPSAGALYPLEIYLVADRITGLEKGIYKYIPQSHSVELISRGEHLEELSVICYNQMFIANGSCAIVMTAIPSRTTRVYNERGLRYIYMEAGHVSENIYLQSASLQLATVAIGAFRDQQLKKMLLIDESEETPVYLNIIGVPAQ